MTIHTLVLSFSSFSSWRRAQQKSSYGSVGNSGVRTRARDWLGIASMIELDSWLNLKNLSNIQYYLLLIFFLFVCCYKTRNPYFTSRPGLEVKPLGECPLGSVALPAVLPKVHYRPESLNVPTKVNTVRVYKLTGGLASLDLTKPRTNKIKSSITKFSSTQKKIDRISKTLLPQQ